MSLLSWLKGLRRRPEPPRFHERALPEPTRVNLADAQVETDFFVRLPEWSSYGPNRAAWELPDQSGQEARYQQLIQEHAERGGLDGLVPDLMDRLIHEEMDELRRAHGTGRGAGAGRPLIDTPIKAGDAVMHMSGATNGRLATQGWRTLSKRTGTPLVELSEEEAGRQITFADTQIKPQPVITTPEWSGSEHGGRRYSAFVVNVEHAKPWHTLTGRMHYYLDHDWMRDMGESLPTFRPPLDFACLYGEAAPGSVSASQAGTAQVAVRYLTIHNKWAIHSQYYDNLYMLTLGRGGQTIWMSPADADKIGVRDNEWVEAYNRNGIVAARAVVSHRIPEGTVFMHHAQERTMNTPVTESSGRRGGTHNSLTRIVLKPSHFAGGYAQLSYAFNYIGPTGNNRDEVTLIRRRTDQEVTF